MISRRRWFIPCLIGLCLTGTVVLFLLRWQIAGWLCGEAFYLGQPTRWWRQELSRWQIGYGTAPSTGEEFIRRQHPSWWEHKVLGKRGTSASWNWHFRDCGLAVMDGDPLAMPVLLELLDCNDQTTRILAIRGLGNIGPPARSVVPRLLQLMEDSDPLIGEECRQALWQIDPEQAGLAGVSRPDWQRLFKEVFPTR